MSKVWGKLGRLAQRVLNRRGPAFVSVHARPKHAAGVGTWPDPLVVRPRVAVVVQGPLVVDDDFTLETVRLYRRLFAPHPVIVSTWEGEPAPLVRAVRLAGAEVVQGPRPDDPGPLNVNLQLASTRTGIAKAREVGAEYVLKTRTDQRIYAPNVAEFLVNLVHAFPVAPGFRQRHRVVSCGRSSQKFGLYHVSDQLLFGHVDDITLYFAAPPRASGLPAGFRDVVRDICRHKSPESYLASTFLAAVGRPVGWTLADSWDAIADHFCIADSAAIDVYWPKYGPHVEHDTRYGTVTSSELLDFREWLALRQSRPDPGRYERALDLPLHAALS